MREAMHGEYKMPGGKLVVIDLCVRQGRLVDVQLSGDFFLEPDGAMHAINAAIEDQPEDISQLALRERLDAALPTDVMMYGISTEAIVVAVGRALHGESTA
jgi:hypothetical protein